MPKLSAVCKKGVDCMCRKKRKLNVCQQITISEEAYNRYII